MVLQHYGRLITPAVVGLESSGSYRHLQPYMLFGRSLYRVWVVLPSVLLERQMTSLEVERGVIYRYYMLSLQLSSLHHSGAFRLV